MRIKPEKINGKTWLSGWGNDEADIMIVVSHPTREDLQQGYLLASIDGEYLASDEIQKACRVVGLNFEEDFWITAMVKYGIGGKDKPSSEQINECAVELDEEIAHVKPKIIIALGAEVFKRLMKQNLRQSDYVGEIVDSPYGKVLVNYSPAQVYRVDPKLRPEFTVNMELAKKYVNGLLKYKDFEYLVVDDPATNRMIVQQCIDDELFTVGYDLEWKGKFKDGEVLYSFQYSVTPDQAIVLPLLTPENPKEENLELLNTMRPLLEHPKVDRVGWNIRADDKRLRAKGFNLQDETLGFDGMKAVAFFDSRWGKGLEYGIRKFTNYRPYYNDFNRAIREHHLDRSEMSDLLFLEPELFFTYAAGDAVSHREACVNMRNQMTKQVPYKVREYFFKTYLPLSNYLLDMESTGIPIDVDCMTELTEQYQTCYSKLDERLKKYTQELGFDTENYNKQKEDFGVENPEELGFYQDFNPRSYKDKQRLFFDMLKLEPAYYVRKGKTKPKAWYIQQKDSVKAQYSPSTNGKSMASIRFSLADALKANPNDESLKRNYNIVKTYLDMARVGVFSNKFFSKQGVTLDTDPELDVEDEGEPLKSSYWAALGEGNRIYPDFYECLDNFRSSSKPNVQNPASKVLSHIPAIFREFDLDPPKNIRNIFYSGHPDWYFAEVDVAGADLAIAAFLSRDPKYIRDILNGGFHTTKMRDYFKDPTLTKDEASKYVTSKSITFRVAYTAGLMSAALPIQAEIYAESGDLVDIELIRYALQTWTNYTTYMDYREACQKQVEHYQYIENMRGMRFYFEDTDDFGIKAGWMNQSLAYPIASELALFMWDISVQMKEYLKKTGDWMKWIFPVNVVHDANYWVIHKDVMKDSFFQEVCKNYFTKEVKIATGDNLGMEMVVSDRWKGKQKIFAAETKWNFQTKSWDWAK